MPTPSPSFTLPPLTPTNPTDGSCHTINIKRPTELATLATLCCQSNCGPIQVSVFLNDSRVFHFRPESVLYNPLNRTTAGNVQIALPTGPTIPRLVVTFANTSEQDGQVTAVVALDVIDVNDQIVLAEKRNLPAGTATSFHIVFMNQ
jgi:hypothetical protein